MAQSANVHKLKVVKTGFAAKNPPMLKAVDTKTVSASAKELKVNKIKVAEATYLCGANAAGICEIYAPACTEIRIEVKDEEYGLTKEDSERIFSMLAHLPSDHIRGIKTIRLRARSERNENPVVHDGELIVYADKQEGHPAQLSLPFAHAIGEHVYQTVLSVEQRAEWATFLPEAAKVDPAGMFGTAYANYVHGSRSKLTVAAENATQGGAQNWAQKNGLDVSTAKANPQSFQQMMFVAFRFINAENAKPYATIRYMDYREDGSFQSKDRKVETYRDFATCYGPLCFEVPIDKNEVRGFFEKPKPPKPGEPNRILAYMAWNPPVALPTPPLARLIAVPVNPNSPSPAMPTP